MIAGAPSRTAWLALLIVVGALLGGGRREARR
jgi:hypothetical protein